MKSTYQMPYPDCEQTMSANAYFHLLQKLRFRMGALGLCVFAAAASATSLAAETPEPAAAIAVAPATAVAAAAAAPKRPAAKAPVELAPVQKVAVAKPADITPPLKLVAGKSTLIRLPAATRRLSVSDPEVADVVLINPREIYMLGKKVGSSNVFVWGADGHTTIMDVIVDVDTDTLKAKLNEFLPSESGIVVASLANSIVLSGQASDPIKIQRAVTLAEAYSGGKKVVNLVGVGGSQQVMLEVKIAEVSKTLLDKLGVQFDATRSVGGTSIRLLSRLLSSSAGALTLTSSSGKTAVTIDAETRRGLVKVLAEPTIMAVSGQEGSFLAGGKIFIPVPQSSVGGTTITLEEKEFGVGLRFTPTVLDEGRINLRVTPEVSELSQIGTTVTGTTVTTAGGATSILPTITTRRASTTVQLRDGESFAIGGLIKNNITETMKALPLLGELPIIGALFRSSEFQSDRSELLFIVTPRLVKPLPPDYALPTDNFIEPSRSEYFIEGNLEGKAKPAPPSASPQSVEPQSAAPQATELQSAAPQPTAPVPAAASGADGGFELR